MNDTQWVLIEDNKECDAIWDRFVSLFHFQPDYSNKTKCPFGFPSYIKHVKVYDIHGALISLDPHDENHRYRTTQQIQTIKSIFAECMGCDEFMYALDWQHSSFKYNPRIEEPFNEYTMYTNLHETRAYYPSFYPNGDFYFFLQKDFEWGYLTHPWQERVWIFGDQLTALFERYSDYLGFNAL